MLKAILFDYNGVLIDDLHIHVESYMKLFRKYGKETSEKERKELT